MKIAINCRSFLIPEHTGIGRYARHLVYNLAKIDNENQYLLYARKNLFDRRRKLPKKVGENFFVRQDVFGKGIDSVVGDADIFHSPSPDFITTKNRKIIVSVHDIIHRTYPQSMTKSSVDLSERYFQDIVQKASKIICCSQSTRNDLHRLFDIDPERSCMIYHGVDHEVFYPIEEDEKFKAQEYLKSQGIDKPYILFVGTIEPRKNLSNILKAFHHLKKKNRFDGYLVVIGMKGWMCEEIAPLIESLDLNEDVKFTGFINDVQLRWFYNLAEVFALPSFYEGFGFPIVEAFCCGTTVVTSNVSSCGEIAGDAAHQVDPKDYYALAKALETICRSKETREKYKERSLQRGKDFSFEKNAQETLTIYQQVMNM